jgi:hypothetical protein
MAPHVAMYPRAEARITRPSAKIAKYAGDLRQRYQNVVGIGERPLLANHAIAVDE